DLDARLYSPAGLIGSTEDSFSAPAGDTALAGLYEQAAQRVSDFVQESWKQANLVSSTVEQRLAVVAPIAGLEDWVDLRRRLVDVSTLRRTDLLRLSRSEARLDLVFVGSREQLASALAQRALALVPAAHGNTPGMAPMPSVPQTSGSVTVYPEAALPPVTAGPGAPAAAPTSAQPAWELRRAAGSTVQPVAPAPALAPAPAPPAAAIDPASSPPAAE